MTIAMIDAEATEVSKDLRAKSPRRSKKSAGVEAMNRPKASPSDSQHRPRKRREAATVSNAGVPESRASDQRDGGGVGIRPDENPSAGDRPATINAIIVIARRRSAGVRAIVSLTNQRLAVIRSSLGFQTTDDEKSRKDAIAASQAIDKALRDAEAGDLSTDHQRVAGMVSLYCAASRSAEQQFKDSIIKPCEKELAALVEQLPEWAKMGQIRGLGSILLAEIIGTVGDLAQYKGPRSLRKMLGAAPYNGKALSTWKKKGGLSADEWAAVKSNPNRYVLLYRLGDCQIKARGPYRAIYDERKVQEAARLDEKGQPVTPMIAHRRAIRVMVSRMLNDLWAMSKGLEPMYSRM